MDVDLVVVGSGPVGLYATNCAGFNGMRTAVIDSLPERGGRISALYSESLIYDIACRPRVKGRDLVAGLLEQANAYSPRVAGDPARSDYCASEIASTTRGTPGNADR